MACFLCKQYGHWSRECPNAVCSYCGNMGHSINACELKNQYKPTVSAPQPEQISRTRTRKTSKTIDDILYENHITVSNTMKEDVDLYIKNNFTKNGMVDEYELAETLFSGDLLFNVGDTGHLMVIGYIISKYCDMSNKIIKTFLNDLKDDIDNDFKFHKILNKCGITSVMKNDKIHFRKLTGYSV